MVTLTINDTVIQVPEGTTVLQAARQAGIHIPTLCDHPALEPYGGCRLCMVEVQGGRGPVASCTLPASDNMVIKTESPAILASRKFVLSMLFSERNHICPFCQVSGGDCELQQSAYDEGMTHWEYMTSWEKFPIDSSHPYFIMEHNRCIVCRRCVRACSDLVGNHTLAMENRGARTMLVADNGSPWGESTCVQCGMCVQVCPTGALIDRQDAYLGHPKHTDTTRTICLGCSLGCGMQIQTRSGHIVRIEGDWENPINGGVLCKAGRILPRYDERPRHTSALLRTNGELQPVSWDEALQAAADGLRKASGFSAVASPRLSAESLCAFKELFTPMGASLAQTQPDLPADPANQSGFDALRTADCVIVLGIDPAASHEVASFFIKRRIQRGLDLVVIDSQENALSERANVVLSPASGEVAALLDQLARGDGSGNTSQSRAAALLSHASQVCVVHAPAMSDLASSFCAALQTRGIPTERIALGGAANSRYTSELRLGDAIQPANAMFLALGDEAPAPALLEAARQARFLVVMASHASDLDAIANVVLPVENWAEMSGHFINLSGCIQTAQAALDLPAGSHSSQETLENLAVHLGSPLSADWRAFSTAEVIKKGRYIL